jgi:flap endonuclease-1
VYKIHSIKIMGVNSLGKLLKTVLSRETTGRESRAMVERDMASYRGQIVTIDASLQLYRFVLAIRNSNGGCDMTTYSGKLTSHLFGIKCKAIQLLRNGIIPIFVFDGKPPSIKRKTLQDRKKIKVKTQEKLEYGEYDSEIEKIKLVKRTFCITERHIIETQQMLNAMGLPYIQAIGEAESQCAALNMMPHVNVNGVVTEDWDALLFGCKKMLKNFSNKGKVCEVNLDILLEELELTHEQFIELCIILGTDYCSGIKGIGPIQAYNEYKRCGSMEKFLGYIKEAKSKSPDTVRCRYNIPKEFEEPVMFEGHIIKRWEVVKEYYLNAYVRDPSKIDLTWKEPNVEEFRNFMVIYNEFERVMINRDINTLMQMYRKYLYSDNGYIHNNYCSRLICRNKEKTNGKREINGNSNTVACCNC